MIIDKLENEDVMSDIECLFTYILVVLLNYYKPQLRPRPSQRCGWQLGLRISKAKAMTGQAKAPAFSGQNITRLKLTSSA